MRSPVISKTAALLQITAIVLIQFYSVAPLFSHHFIAYARVMRCTGDHARCGCSPERIASHTCCCYQSKRLGFMTPAPGGGNSASGKAQPVAPMTLVQGDAGPSTPSCCKNTNSHKDTPAHYDSGQAGPEAPKKPSCCDKKTDHKETFGKDDHNRPIPCICSVPCGGDPAFISVALEKLKFLRPTIRHLQPEVFTAEYPFLPQTAYQGRSLEPPDPPPRLSRIS